MIALSLPKNHSDMDKYGKIIKIGNSCGMIFPARLLRDLSINADDSVCISVVNRSIVITKQEPYTGPYTGIFADMPRPKPGEPDPWDGKDSSEIMEELRSGRLDRNKNLDW